MKKILIRVALGVVALIVVALLVVFFSLNSIVKAGVDRVGPMITKTDVTLGSAEISPFAGGGRLTKLFVGNPQGYKSASAMEVGDIKLSTQLGSLMSDTIVIKEINIQNAEITLEGGLNDNNLTKLEDNINGSSAEAGNQPKPKGAPPQAGASKSSKKFIVKDLVIAGAKVHLDVTLPGVGEHKVTLPLPELHLQEIGTSEGGVTAEQLTQAIMKPLLASVTTAATQQVASLGGDLKNLGKTGTDGINKVTKGIGGLFKKQ